MPAFTEPLIKGFRKSIGLLWLLIKIIVPVSCLVALLDFYGIVDQIAIFFTPAMSLFGLPGEAAISLLLGFLVNIYAAMGAVTAISLTAQQMTILAVIIGICHELPVETMICRYTGLRIPVSIALRLTTAVVAGVLLNLIYTLVQGG
ncbi:MAG: nucleoside recognition protein [Firmicutes bacterium]|nr:nucleoside recognition protein [Bacillota bacterium]